MSHTSRAEFDALLLDNERDWPDCHSVAPRQPQLAGISDGLRVQLETASIELAHGRLRTAHGGYALAEIEAVGLLLDGERAQVVGLVSGAIEVLVQVPMATEGWSGLVWVKDVLKGLVGEFATARLPEALLELART